jgi:hypothetical protein
MGNRFRYRYIPAERFIATECERTEYGRVSTAENASGVILNGNTTMSETLTLTSSLVTLGTSNLLLLRWWLLKVRAAKSILPGIR